MTKYFATALAIAFVASAAPGLAPGLSRLTEELEEEVVVPTGLPELPGE